MELACLLNQAELISDLKLVYLRVIVVNDKVYCVSCNLANSVCVAYM